MAKFPPSLIYYYSFRWPEELHRKHLWSRCSLPSKSIQPLNDLRNPGNLPYPYCPGMKLGRAIGSILSNGACTQMFFTDGFSCGMFAQSIAIWILARLRMVGSQLFLLTFLSVTDAEASYSQRVSYRRGSASPLHSAHCVDQFLAIWVQPGG